jgi:hypothetical protein
MEGQKPNKQSSISQKSSSKQKAEGGAAGVHCKVPSSRQWAISQEPMKAVGSQVTEHAKGNTMFQSTKAKR